VKSGNSQVVVNRPRCMLRWLGWLVLLLAPVWGYSAAIQRTITIDGVFSDWTSPTNILTNSGQFSTDGDGTCPGSTDNDAYNNGDPATGTCDGLSGTGRDLKEFAFTWDNDNLYLYVERFASESNVTDWWFYIDADNDGLMESSDILFRVKWSGSNQNTERELWEYVPVAAGGDPLTGASLNQADGYTMPGTVKKGKSQALGSATAGSVNGLQMETFLPWDLICGTGCGPTSVRFHIASSNGTNIPSSIVDNMDGPGGNGGQIQFFDLAVGKSASVTSAVGGGSPFDYTLTITNTGGGDATGVSLTDVLPAGVTYVSSSASVGSYDPASGLWTVGTLLDAAVATLTITVTPDAIASATVVTNTASGLTLNEADTDSTNNSAAVDVSLTFPPLLSITKVANRSYANPQDVIVYTITVQNLGGGPAVDVVVEDDPSTFSALSMDAYGAGQPFLFTDGASSSGLGLGSAEYSDNNGTDFNYSLTSGSGNASAGFDGQLTNWRIPMSGSMAPGSSFTINYQMEVK